MDNHHQNNRIKKEDPDQLFDLLNLSPPGEYQLNTFEANLSFDPSGVSSTTSTSTPPFNQQQFTQLNGVPFNVESPISDINSPVEMFTNINSNNNNNRYQTDTQGIQQLLDNHQQSIRDQLFNLQQQHLASQQQQEHQQQQQQYQQQPYVPPQANYTVPFLNFDSPPAQNIQQQQNNLIPNSNQFYSNISNNNSTSNLTAVSTQSYVSASQEPPSDHNDLAASLLSPYESGPFGSHTPTHSSSRAASPFLATSPFSDLANNNEDDNLSIYQTIEHLNIDNSDSGLELSQHERLLIEKEFSEQESKLNIPEIVQHDASNKLTEDNLHNNNNMLQHTPPITINIQAPEEIAAKTPSLFSLSNSQRSTPVNSPKNRSRSSSFENRERPQLGDSLVPSFSIHDSNSSSSVKQEEDDSNLLRPGDSDFQRMRHGRRLSNASRSRSRSRSRSADSRKSDISDPTKNREKMIELAAPHSNKRTQKHPSVHACHLCDKTFTRPYNLKSHLRTHTDERPFICSTCGKAFARQHDKKRHEDLHTGEKRFQCKGLLYDGVTEWGCGKRFARADALGRHFKTESGRECVRPLLEDDRRRKSIANGGGEVDDIKEKKITDDMLNGFDFNEIFESQMKKE